MRITFIQSGGFAGAVRHACLDTAGLAADERHAVEALVTESGLTMSWERFASAARDLKRYEIVIAGAAGTIRVACDDRCLPDRARPLVGFLIARSRPGLPPADPPPDPAAGS